MARRWLLAWVAVAGLLALATVTTPTADARPAYEIPVTQSPGDLGGPTAAGWSEVPTATVPLASAPSSVPNANDTTVEELRVQAARGDGRLYLRLRWHDPTRDGAADGPRGFADAVAVELPVNTSARPPIAMGGPGNPVNVWYWSAGGRSQELLAGGAGSTTRMDENTVGANATYRNDTWVVQYSRPVEGSGENRTTVPEDRDLDVAFAVWNGSNGERAGQKAVSEWYYLPFGAGPQGPPYETLLWSVAGLAIVAVLAVTAYGVSRTGGGG